MDSLLDPQIQNNFNDTNIRFYLVDDDELFHLIHKRFLKSQLPKAEIISFLDPREALKAIIGKTNDPTPSVLLLDLNMPYLTGWEWLDAYARQVGTPPASLKIFILSSSDSVQDRNRARNYSCIAGYLVKPLTKEAIATLL